MPVFYFKKFSLSDEACAMKIGTDAVLLGAWMSKTNLRAEPLTRILDVGTGCGILALMMAQRTRAVIDAVEIDELGSKTCMENFRNSPWSDRLFLYNKEFNRYTNLCRETYDLVCSNPPFFTNSLKNPDPHRAQARHDTLLDISTLLFQSYPLLSSHGRIALIYPSRAMPALRQAVLNAGLFFNRITWISSQPAEEPVRVMVEMVKHESEIQEDTMAIRNQDHQFSLQYKALTADFYLAF